MWWIVIVLAVVFFVGIFLEIVWVDYKGDKERMRQEDAWIKQRMRSGHDPTYDEHGRLRK